MNKAYRTLLAGVLSMLFMGSALGCEVAGETKSGAGPDAPPERPGDAAAQRRRSLSTVTALPPPAKADPRFDHLPRQPLR